MSTTYTTHLICAPQLAGAATIGALLVTPGQYVTADAPLLQLLVDEEAPQEVYAPEAGLVGGFTVALHERVSSCDLLLTMEIEEKATQLFPLLDDEPAFAPVCAQSFAADAVPVSIGALQVAPAAARLAAALALDLAEVAPGPDGIVDEDAVTDHVRDILIRWRKLRRLVQD